MTIKQAGTLKACSICGAPGVQMWDPEENIIKCSSEGSCHNALYGMSYNEWQSRPLEDALAAKNFELFMSPEAKKYIDDDRLSVLAAGLELIKKSECIMTTGEQHEGNFIICQKCRTVLPPQIDRYQWGYCPACGRAIKKGE